MSLTIWKFPLNVAEVLGFDGSLSVCLPIGAEILKVGKQPGDEPGRLQLWAIVDPNAKIELRTIYILATGFNLHPAVQLPPHLDTVIDGPMVWHVFAEVA